MPMTFDFESESDSKLEYLVGKSDSDDRLRIVLQTERGPRPYEGVLAIEVFRYRSSGESQRAYLDRADVAALLPYLERFARTGRLGPGEES